MPGAAHELTVPFRPPFAFDRLLEFLRPRAIPGVEAVDAAAYRRTHRVGRRSAVIEVRRAARVLRVSVRTGAGPLPPEAAEEIATRVAHLFDTATDPRRVADRLSADPALVPLLAAQPGLRVPGAWDGFEIGVRAILGQQVTVKGASTLSGRFAAAYGSPLPMRLRESGLAWTFPSGPRVAGRAPLSIGVPDARAGALRAWAAAVGRLGLRPGDARGEGLEEFVGEVCRLPGLGPWTAHYVAMRARHDPDAFPSGDLALQRAPTLGARPLTARALEARAEGWRPFRAYAAMYLWRAYAERAGRTGGG